MTMPLHINARELMSNLVPNRRYATHGFDSYPAKMTPHIARLAITKCSQEGESVLDPFCGCGTVIVESRITGRKSTGIDINPLAVLYSRAKSHLYNSKKLELAIRRAAEFTGKSKLSLIDVPEWVKYWFSESALELLVRSRDVIAKLAADIEPCYIDALRTILAKTARLVSKADPRSPKPFISKKARLTRVDQAFDVIRIFEQEGRIFSKASASLRELVCKGRPSSISIKLGDARNFTSAGKGKKFDAVISSPPYLSAQDYYRSSKIELAVLGAISGYQYEELGSGLVGSGRGRHDKALLLEVPYCPSELERLRNESERASLVVAKFLKDMHIVIHNCYGLLKGGGFCCLVIGDCILNQINLPVHSWIIKLGEMSGLSLQEHLIDTVRDRRVPPQRQGHASVIMHEHILIFRKPLA
jgi:methylase of polypeptide subunit release factors